MHRRWILIAIVLLAGALPCVFVAAPVRAGTTITVNSALDVIDPNDGKCTLREAVIAANTDKASGGMVGECPAGSGADTIILPAGTFLLTIAPLNITSSVTILGAGESATIIDASAIHDRVMQVSASPFTLGNLRIQNGHRIDFGGGLYLVGVARASLSHLSVMSSTAEYGGGIFAENAGLVMTNVLLANNDASNGGGYYNFESSAAFTAVTLTNNGAASSGGGIGNANPGALSLNGVTVSHNEAFLYGAGISNFDLLTVTNSVLSGNVVSSTTGVGGGIYDAFTMTLNTVVIMSNTAESGGGIFSEANSASRLDNVTLGANSAITGGAIFNRGTSHLTNATLSGNSGGNCSGIFHLGLGLGGAIYNLTGTLTLINATVANNCTQNLAIGAGLQVVNGTVQAKNSIFYQTGGRTCTGTLTSLGHNLDSLSDCNFHQMGDVNGVNPLLGPLANNGGPLAGAAPVPLLTHALLPNSPAIDAADNLDCPAFDERGYQRPVDGNRDGVAVCDIGAYEAWLLTFLPLVVR